MRPRSHGLAQRGLADLLAAHASRLGVPGAVLGVAVGDRSDVVSFGVADARTQQPVTPGTPFSLGSLTKSIVASVVAGLVSRGGLSLDMSVAEAVPETRGSPWAEGASIRDLLANRSGVALCEHLEFGFDERTETDDGARARFAREVSAASPGPDVWSYSNSGWCLLGRAVEIATGATFEQAARRELSSAGVRDVHFADEGVVAGRASGHDLRQGEPIAVPPLLNHVYASAGTSAVGTAGSLLDLARWHLEAAHLAMLRETTTSISIPGWLDGWGLGWARFDWSDGPAWGWDGMVPGERVCLRLLPEHVAAFALLANADSGRALARSLLPEVVDAVVDVTVPGWGADPTSGASADLAAFAGVYAWPDRRVEVTVDNGALRITEGDQEMRARPVDARTFSLEDGNDDQPAVTFDGFDATDRPAVLYDMVWAIPREPGQVGETGFGREPGSP